MSVNTDTSPRRINWQRSESAQTPPPTSSGLPRVLMGVLGVGMMLATVGLWGASRLMTPARDDFKVEREQLVELQRQDKLQAVVDLADTHLSQQQRVPTLEARENLASLRYYAAQTLALRQARADDVQSGRQTIDKLLEVEAKADEHGLSATRRVAPLTTYREAIDRSLWEVARFAFLVAWERGDVRSQDTTMISSYYALLHNYGNWLVQRGDRAHTDEGLVMLASSEAVNINYGLKRGESALSLTNRLGPNRAGWPAPVADDPVVHAKNTMRGGIDGTISTQ
ncbi:MAG: hypothetical protein ACKVVP_07270 [Chloroflexota bacterium]